MTSLLTALLLATATPGVAPASIQAAFSGMAVTQDEIQSGGTAPAAAPAPAAPQAEKGPAATAPNPPTTGGSEQPKPPQGPDTLVTLLMFGGIFLVFWLFIIRPQNKKMKEHQKLISGLKKGDSVVTQGGILGRIVGFDDATNAALVEVAKDVRIRVIRTQIAGLQGQSDGSAPDAPKTTPEKE